MIGRSYYNVYMKALVVDSLLSPKSGNGGLEYLDKCLEETKRAKGFIYWNVSKRLNRDTKKEFVVVKTSFLLSDLPQITIRSELLSQIRGSVVVLRDQIHRELGNLINLIRVIKLGWLWLNVNSRFVSKAVARFIWLGFWYLEESS